MPPLHIKKTNVPALAGYSDETIPPGEMGRIVRRGFLNSDQALFPRVIEQFALILLGEEYMPSDGYDFQAIIHRDSSADVIVNGVPALFRAMAKRYRGSIGHRLATS